MKNYQIPQCEIMYLNKEDIVKCSNWNAGSNETERLPWLWEEGSFVN